MQVCQLADKYNGLIVLGRFVPLEYAPYEPEFVDLTPDLLMSLFSLPEYLLPRGRAISDELL